MLPETELAPTEAALAVCSKIVEAAGAGDPTLVALLGLVTVGFVVYRKVRK